MLFLIRALKVSLFLSEFLSQYIWSGSLWWGCGGMEIHFYSLCCCVQMCPSIDKLFQVEFKCYICCICYCENLI
jgi:hypothetical protein